MSWLDTTEARALVRLQRVAARRPLTDVAHVLSSAGEHAWLWLVLTGSGAALDRSRRQRWIEAGVAIVGAHGSAVVLKRIVRRERPHATGLQVLDRTASRLSFPSAHAASTTAAALATAPLIGAGVTAPVALSMYAARLLLGVHYPTDVSAGALLGLLSVRAVRRVSAR
jgi:membrane-associated phospholipid phosphatase